MVRAGPGNEQALVDGFDMSEAEVDRRRELSTVS